MKQSAPRLKQNFNKTIQKGYEQGIRVRQKIKRNDAKYYDSDNRETRKQIINLSDYDYEDTYVVVVTLMSYLNLADSLHLLLDKHTDDPFPWALDVFSLEHIFRKCMRDTNSDQLIDYIKKRILEYGSTVSMSADELDYFGFYLRYGKFYGSSFNGIHVRLGPGYSSFVVGQNSDVTGYRSPKSNRPDPNRLSKIVDGILKAGLSVFHFLSVRFRKS